MGNNKASSKKNNWLTIIILIAVLLGGGQGLQLFGDTDSADSSTVTNGTEVAVEYEFRTDALLAQHYEKHGIEMGFETAEEYERAANAVVANEDVLHKIEAEDGDDVYYLEETNEFVVISTDGYIRTYFYPSDGIEYFERQ